MGVVGLTNSWHYHPTFTVEPIGTGAHELSMTHLLWYAIYDVYDIGHLSGVMRGIARSVISRSVSSQYIMAWLISMAAYVAEGGLLMLCWKNGIDDILSKGVWRSDQCRITNSSLQRM